VDRPSADHLHDPVPGLLQAEALLDRGPVVLGHVESARIAEEVGKVEQVDVERMALDPFPAVEESAERPGCRVDRDPKAMLERVDGGHLVRDGADAADARDDVDDLVGRPPDHEPLEVARGLEDLEVRLLHDAVLDHEAQRPLALDPGQAGDVDGEVPGGAGERVGVMHLSVPSGRRPGRVGRRRHR
jgi:hypothetical protein